MAHGGMFPLVPDGEPPGPAFLAVLKALAVLTLVWLIWWWVAPW